MYKLIHLLDSTIVKKKQLLLTENVITISHHICFFLKKKSLNLKRFYFFDINNNSISALGRFNKQSLSSVWCKTSLFYHSCKTYTFRNHNNYDSRKQIVNISVYFFVWKKKKCFLGRYTIFINYAKRKNIELKTNNEDWKYSWLNPLS